MCSFLAYRLSKTIWLICMILALSAFSNGAALADAVYGTCVVDRDWSGVNWEVPIADILTDCYYAAQILINTDMTTLGNGWFEFVKGDRPGIYHRYPVVTTPRKYTFGRCVLALITVDYFVPQSLLPDVSLGQRYPEDEARFTDVINKALDLRRKCLGLHEPLPGWTQFGRNTNSLGLLMVGKGSMIDQVIVDASRSGNDRALPLNHTLLGMNRTTNGIVTA